MKLRNALKMMIVFIFTTLFGLVLVLLFSILFGSSSLSSMRGKGALLLMLVFFFFVVRSGIRFISRAFQESIQDSPPIESLTEALQSWKRLEDNLSEQTPQPTERTTQLVPKEEVLQETPQKPIVFDSDDTFRWSFDGSSYALNPNLFIVDGETYSFSSPTRQIKKVEQDRGFLTFRFVSKENHATEDVAATYPPQFEPEITAIVTMIKQIHLKKS